MDWLKMSRVQSRGQALLNAPVPRRRRASANDGKQIWLEPDEAKVLRELGCFVVIKPTESYWAISNKSKPHLDPDHGGLYRDSYGGLYCPELDRLCRQNREFVARNNRAIETRPWA
jgi:hypothetical protein